MDALIDQVKRTAAAADETERKKLIDALSDLQLSIESPNDSMQRISYLVCIVFNCSPVLRDPLINLCSRYDRR
jgi:demethylsterigmatocystin 6-O-methyltransferase